MYSKLFYNLTSSIYYQRSIWKCTLSIIHSTMWMYRCIWSNIYVWYSLTCTALFTWVISTIHTSNYATQLCILSLILSVTQLWVWRLPLAASTAREWIIYLSLIYIITLIFILNRVCNMCALYVCRHCQGRSYAGNRNIIWKFKM